MSSAKNVARKLTSKGVGLRSVLEMDSLASSFVGDAGTPNLYFVSANGRTVGVLTDRVAAIAAAESLAERGSAREILVEDRQQGTIWDKG